MIETITINGVTRFVVVLEIGQHCFVWAFDRHRHMQTRYQIAKLAASHKTVFDWWDVVEVYKLMGQAMKETR
jgi:hypothetical protein